MKDLVLAPALRFGRELLKAGLATAFADTGLIDILCRLRTGTIGPRIHVLGYHRVVDWLDMTGASQPINPALCITTDSFRRQMEQVRGRFEVLTLEDALRAIDGEIALDRDACAVTFDDGYHDVLQRAHPILAELGIPATVFVPTGPAQSGGVLVHDRLYASFWLAQRQERALRGVRLPLELTMWVRRAETLAHQHGPAAAVDMLIAGLSAAELDDVSSALEAHLGGPPPDGGRLLNPGEIRTLADAGWEVGAHTVGHVVLTHEPLARVREELARPRRDLEAWTGRPCRYLAYCNGLYSRSIVTIARQAGYLGAVTTCDRPNAPGGDRMRVSRKVMWEGHSRGPDGRFAPAVSAAHLHDLFGFLRLTSPVTGEVHTQHPEVQSCGTW